jgi:hypothetical protein
LTRRARAEALDQGATPAAAGTQAVPLLPLTLTQVFSVLEMQTMQAAPSPNWASQSLSFAQGAQSHKPSCAQKPALPVVR